MLILKVIPIDKGVFKDELTYFTSKEVEVGDIVTVTVKNREINGLVIESLPAEEAKSAIKNADFKLKKVEKIKKGNLFSPQFIEANNQLARYYAASPGQTLKSFIPKTILEESDKLISGNNRNKNKEVAKSAEGTDGIIIKQHIFTIQDSDEERLTYYKSLTREAFAKQSSVLLCLPTQNDIEQTLEQLGRGIIDYTIVLHSKMTKKELLIEWKKALANEHPILIVTTPLFLSINRQDIATIIIDKENSPIYKDFNRPFADARKLAEFYAKLADKKLILGDIVLRTETIFRTENKEFAPVSNLKFRSVSDAKQIFLPINNQKDEEEMDYQVVGRELEEIIKNSHEQNENTIVLAARRGLALTTVCDDCGTIITCRDCGNALVVHHAENHNIKEKNVFICHKCGAIHTPEDKCPTCGGWRLALLGIGIERLEGFFSNRCPEIPVFRLDSDSVKTSKKARELVEKFYTTPGSLLLATEMAYYYAHDPVANVALAAIDSFFSIPGFRTRERAFNLFLRFRTLATKRFIVQTRNPDEKIFNHLLSGNILDFYREEVAEREKFHYPPFETIIKITRIGKKTEVIQDMKKLEKLLVKYQPSIFASFSQESAVKYTAHALLKVRSTDWPNQELLDILSSIPPVFIINVDPEDIL
jgi:primosomal protein N'